LLLPATCDGYTWLTVKNVTTATNVFRILAHRGCPGQTAIKWLVIFMVKSYHNSSNFCSRVYSLSATL